MIIRGDARHLPLRSNSVDVVVSSPPYLAQRTYGTDADREIGRTNTLQAYVASIGEVFDELHRVVKPTGWAFLNIGDKANGSGGAGGDWNRPGNSRTWQASSQGPAWFRDSALPMFSFVDVPGAIIRDLLTRGWRLRMPIVWEKTSTREPASMKHLARPLWSHEMILAFCPERVGSKPPRSKWFPSQLAETGSVWHFKPGGNGDPHLAPFPDELARRCILPTTLPGDIVLDPFSGSGTVERVAGSLGRRGIGVDIYAGRPDLVHGIGAA